MLPAQPVCAIVMLLALSPGSAPLDAPLPAPGTDAIYECFQYDDGSANWLSWLGQYRGVWFNLEDFYVDPTIIRGLEFWFYHHSSYPWDTSLFYAEFYTGDAAAPATLLNQTSVSALHYSPVYAKYHGYGVIQHFWGVMNSEMSAGGWPALLGDCFGNITGYDHSFYSDDFIVWNPWIPGITGLERNTWGALKVLYTHPERNTPGCCDYFIRAIDYGG